MTRQSTAILETSTGRQFRFGQPGPVWQAEDTARAMAEIEALLEPEMLVVATGSLPPGVPDDFYVGLGKRVKAAGAEMIVDTSGAAQKAILAAGHGLVKVLRMDRHESEQLAGEPLETPQAAARFAETIAKQGLAELVIMARGANGSVFASAAGCFHCVSPKGAVVSKVGAGDSFVGGLTLGLARGLSLEEAGKLATATAAAAVMTPGSQLCEKATTERLLAGTLLTKL
jgi:6-phosphofructokinase 2